MYYDDFHVSCVGGFMDLLHVTREMMQGVMHICKNTVGLPYIYIYIRARQVYSSILHIWYPLMRIIYTIV